MIGDDGTGDNIDAVLEKHAREGSRGAKEHSGAPCGTHLEYAAKSMVDEGRAGDGHNVRLSEQGGRFFFRVVAGLHAPFDHPDVSGCSFQVIDKWEVAYDSDVLALSFPGKPVRGIEVDTFLRVYVDEGVYGGESQRSIEPVIR